jgi:hypothetical protein
VTPDQVQLLMNELYERTEAPQDATREEILTAMVSNMTVAEVRKVGGVPVEVVDCF